MHVNLRKDRADQDSGIGIRDSEVNLFSNFLVGSANRSANGDFLAAGRANFDATEFVIDGYLAAVIRHVRMNGFLVAVFVCPGGCRDDESRGRDSYTDSKHGC